MNKWKQIIELAVHRNFWQIRVVAPRTYKFITLAFVEGLLATVEETMGKQEKQYE